MKRHICYVIHSRANYARIKTAIQSSIINNESKVSVILGSSSVLDKYGDVEKLLIKDDIHVESKLYNVVAGDNPIAMVRTTSLATIDLSASFARLKPDIVVTVADRHETLGTAIAASYMNIFLAHTQGGEITGSIDESVRHACTKLSNIHFAATKQSYENIIQMGEIPENVKFTGCPSIDLCVNEKNLKLDNLKINSFGVGYTLDLSKPYLLVIFHPVTNELNQIENQIETLIKSIKKLGIQTIWLWPNIDSGSDIISKKMRSLREDKENVPIRFFKNFSAEDFVAILKNTICIVGNSSSGIRESSFLGTPSVQIGNRQLGREHGDNVRFVEIKENEIISAVKKQITSGKFKSQKIFGDGNAGSAIAQILDHCDLNTVKRFQKII